MDINLLVDRFFWFVLGAVTFNLATSMIIPQILPWVLAPILAIALSAKAISAAAK